MSPRRAVLPPEVLRDRERLVGARHEQGEGRLVRSHVGDLLTGDIDVDIRRGEDHVLDFRRDASVADRHLPQALERQPVAHRMGEDRDLGHLRVGGEPAQHTFELVARIGRAFPVVAVGQHAGLRWPGEQHRHGLGAGIMDDLSEAVDGVLETIVEPVHEHQHLPLRRLADLVVDDRHGVGARDDRCAASHEVGRGIARQAFRPLHLADLAMAVGRQGHVDVREGHHVGAQAVEHDAR